MRNFGWLRAIALAGLVWLLPTGALAAGFTVAPTQFDFGSVPVFATGQGHDFTLTNGTASTVTISSITSSTNDFVVFSSCPRVFPGLGCTFQIAPKPQSVGLVSATVTVKSDAPSGDIVIPVTATAVGGIIVSPDSLAYTNINPNTSSPAQTITIGNGTSGTISPVISLGDAANYSLTNPCPSSLTVGQTCMLSVTFTPKSTGIFQSSISITESSQAFTKNIGLKGTAGLPLSVSPSQVTFPDQQVGTTSAAIPVQVTNNTSGNVSVLISTNTQTTSFFATLGGCFSASLSFGQSCSFNVFFSPKSAGPLQDAVTINFGPQIQLSGNGVTTGGPALTIGPSPTLADTAVGQNTSGTVTLTNISAGPVNITSVTVTGTAPAGVFTTSNNCPSPLGAGSNCKVTVTFTPNAVTQFTGTLNVFFDNVGSPLSVGITANGTAPQPALTIGPSPTLNTTTLGQNTSGTVTLTNVSAVPVNITSVNITGTAPGGVFTTSNNCPTPLPSGTGSNCIVTVTFTPNEAKQFTGTLNVAFDNTGSPLSVGLSATGSATGPFGFTKIPLAFAAQVIGSTSPTIAATLTNNSGSAVTVNSITASGDFLQTNACPATMSNGSSCNISVNFHPTALGTRTGAVTVTSSVGTKTLNLTGTGQNLAIIFQRPPRTAKPN